MICLLTINVCKCVRLNLQAHTMDVHLCVERGGTALALLSLTHSHIHTYNRVTPRVDGLHCAQALPRCQGWNNRYCVWYQRPHRLITGVVCLWTALAALTAERMHSSGVHFLSPLFRQFPHLLKCARSPIIYLRDRQTLLLNYFHRKRDGKETSFLQKWIIWERS